MHHSGPLPLAFEGPEQGFGGKNCLNGSRGKTWSRYFVHNQELESVESFETAKYLDVNIRKDLG